jgi:small subunit ribosomal protein S6
MMNNYETVFIATPVLSDEQARELAGKFQGVITENGGQITNFEDWGLKKLEYPIQKKTTGFYFFVEFTGEGTIIDTLETQYRRDERVIRFLTFKQDKFAVEYSEKRRNKLSGKTAPAAHATETKTEEE